MTLASPDIALDPTLRDDHAVFWRLPRHGGIDFLRATFRRHRYVRHTHATYAIAAVRAGCETFFHRGEQRYAGPGDIAIVCPDELHDGEPYGEGFVYRTCYPSPALMQEIAEDVVGRPLAHPPWFPRSVVHDPELAAAFAALHEHLHARIEQPPLAHDGRLVAVLGLLIARWSDLDAPPAPLAPRDAMRGVARARDHLDAHFEDEVGLDALAAIAGLSRTHLIRAFRRETGLTPHAYLIDRRFREACHRLGMGEAPGTVAAACGFFDQSHLNRVFKARMAITPGAFRAS